MYNSESSLMETLGITSWRNLSKEKFIEFVSMMPDMSDEVRMKVIEQIPQFTQLCRAYIDSTAAAYNNMLEKNDRTTSALIEKIDNISDALKTELNKGDIPFENKKYIIDQLMEIAKIYDSMDERSKKFFDTTFGKVLIGFGSALGAVIMFVGGKYLFSSKK